MAPDLKALGIDQLSVEDRLELMNAIWGSIPKSTLTPAQEEELDRRLDAIDAERATFVPYEEVRSEMDSRFGK